VEAVPSTRQTTPLRVSLFRGILRLLHDAVGAAVGGGYPFSHVQQGFFLQPSRGHFRRTSSAHPASRSNGSAAALSKERRPPYRTSLPCYP